MRRRPRRCGGRRRGRARFEWPRAVRRVARGVRLGGRRLAPWDHEEENRTEREQAGDDGDSKLHFHSSRARPVYPTPVASAAVRAVVTWAEFVERAIAPTDANAATRLHRLRENLESVLLGKPAAVRLAIIGLLGRGHLLLEDVPGVGKTTLAKALARSIGGTFKRVQFTSDLLPSDIVGASVFVPGDRALRFEPGPIFTHVLLADEINRTPPRTQSSLLEAMDEHTVTVDGETRALPDPFFVVATLNPT
ncbi:MAG: AAA family ATPase, partial [Planctomycetes bacterium]|nr:AAA family ATPase [Planctomycetota bacterium]